MNTTQETNDSRDVQVTGWWCHSLRQRLQQRSRFRELSRNLSYHIMAVASGKGIKLHLFCFAKSTSTFKMQKEDLIYPFHRSEDLELKSTNLCIIGRNRWTRHQINCTCSLIKWDSDPASENTSPIEGLKSRVAGGVHWRST